MALGGTFEKALDRSERDMTVLGSRLLETQKRASELLPLVRTNEQETELIGKEPVPLPVRPPETRSSSPDSFRFA